MTVATVIAGQVKHKISRRLIRLLLLLLGLTTVSFSLARANKTVEQPGLVGTSISIVDFHVVRTVLCDDVPVYGVRVAGDPCDVRVVLVKPVADLGVGVRCSLP